LKRTVEAEKTGHRPAKIVVARFGDVDFSPSSSSPSQGAHYITRGSWKDKPIAVSPKRSALHTLKLLERLPEGRDQVDFAGTIRSAWTRWEEPGRRA